MRCYNSKAYERFSARVVQKHFCILVICEGRGNSFCPLDIS